MLELIRSLIPPSQSIPQGHSYLWQFPLMLLSGDSDAWVAIASCSIPIILIYLGRRRAVAVLAQFWPRQSPQQLERINQALQTQIAERNRTEARLRQVVAGTSSVTGEEFFAALVRHLSSALNVDYALICEVVDPASQTFRTLAFWSVDHLAQNTTLVMQGLPCGLVVERQQLCCFPEQLQDLFPASSLFSEMQAVSYVGVPLFNTGQEVIGTLCILDTKPLVEDDSTTAIMSVFGGRAAAELQRQRAEAAKRLAYAGLESRVQERTCELVQTNTALETEIQERRAAEAKIQKLVERERATTRVILRMRQSLDLSAIFNITTKDLRQIVGCDRTLIYQFNPDWSGTVVAESVAAGWDAIIPQRTDNPTLTQGLIDNAACVVKQMDGSEVLIQDTYLQTTEGGRYRQKSGQCCVSNIYLEGFDDCYLALLESLQAKAYVIVPIFCGNQLWGLLSAYENTGPRQWQESEIEVLSQVSQQLGIAVQQAELLAQTRQQAKELKLAKEAADAANRSKSEFLANMSHELRTPLNAVLGFSQLMVLDRTLNPIQQEHLSIINRSGEHLLRLINDVLEMSKIEAGRVLLDENSFNLYQLLSGIEDMLRLRAKTKGIALTFEWAVAVPEYVTADERKLRQVLINLVGNAVKFTEQGSITVRVTRLIPSLTDAADADATPRINLRFEVEDTGLGIELSEQSSLFKAFTQTETGLSALEGTGLGLAISQKFVQLMGGKISVVSHLGQGTRFWFDLAVGSGKKLALSLPSTLTQAVRAIAPNQATYRILVVEDNPTNRLLLMRMLSLYGFELREAVNGQEAIAIWQDWQPHLIFMDMRMPIMTGIEATRQIKSTPQGKNTVIIALTASAFDQQQQAFFTVGCDDLIRKPFQHQELVEKLTQHLGIQYLYAEETLAPKLDSLTTDIEMLQSLHQAFQTCLASLPVEWATKLQQAALEGNDARILELLQHLAPDQVVVKNGITQLAEDFQFGHILDLF